MEYVFSKLQFSKISLRLAAVLIVGACAGSSAFSQEQTRYVLTLDDQRVESFKTVGHLTSTPSTEAIGKITTIEIGYSAADTKAPLAQTKGLEVVGKVARIYLDDAMLEKMKTNPIRFESAKSDFKMIQLVYSGGVADMRNAVKSEPPKGPTHFVRLPDNNVLSGVLDSPQGIKLATKFGPVEIGAEQIAGIRFNIDQQKSAVIVLKNGDSVTGIPEIDALILKTDWGKAEIDPIYVESITTSQHAQFQKQQNQFAAEARWILIRR